MNTKYKKLYSFLTAGLVLGAVLLAPFLTLPVARAAEGDVTVTIVKFIDGQMATIALANNASFTMNASWNASNIGSGSGQYALSANGFGGDPTPYQAVTANMASGADYSTSEVVDGTTVATECTVGSSNPPFALIGYSTGDTLLAAAQASASLTAPAFTGLTTSKFVVVWNKTCTDVVPPATVKVHIMKYLDNAEATTVSANNTLFPMNATWTATNLNGGVQTSGTYTLGNGSDSNFPYRTETVDLQSGASYSTSENTSMSGQFLPLGATCSDGKYRLEGYKSSMISFADAINGPQTTVFPSFTNLTSDAYVVVLNSKCGGVDGTIDGDVTGGIVDHGTLAVTSVTPVRTTANADGTFANGWKYIFHITVPDNETNLSMKFGNWVGTPSTNTISAANNIRIYTEQDQVGSTNMVTVTAANTYTSPALHITGDVNTSMPGKQIDLVVETAVPATTVNGSYSTSYSVQTLP